MNRAIRNKLKHFTKERRWYKYHTPANLAKSISIEANELLELFQWNEDIKDLERVKEELADVLIYCYNLAICLDVDIDSIVLNKIAKNEKKHPIGEQF